MNNILSTLGLVKKAGKLASGTDMVLEKLASSKVYLIFVASDASPSTIDKVERKGFFYKVPVVKSFTSNELNDAIGCENVKVIGILDSGFAKSLKKNLLVEEERED